MAKAVQVANASVQVACASSLRPVSHLPHLLPHFPARSHARCPLPTHLHEVRPDPDDRREPEERQPVIIALILQLGHIGLQLAGDALGYRLVWCSLQLLLDVGHCGSAAAAGQSGEEQGRVDAQQQQTTGTLPHSLRVPSCLPKPCIQSSRIQLCSVTLP